MAKRRRYSEEFKVQAVKMVTEQGLSLSEVAKDLGIHHSMLAKWIKKLEQEQGQAFRGNGNRTAEEEELHRLREENRKLRMERDILKKAAAFFAKQSP